MDIGELDQAYSDVRKKFIAINEKLNGSPAKLRVGEKIDPVISERLFAVARGVDRSTYGPTATHRQMMEIANSEIATIHGELKSANEELGKLVQQLVKAGGPWLEGETLPELK